jgi:hypothetical protein
MKPITSKARTVRTPGPGLVADLARDGYVLAVGALVLANVALLWIGFTHSPVDLDEGFGLSIVHNLVTGNGYATEGIGDVQWLMRFDAGASTGPVVLLPAAAIHALGVDIVVSGRAVGSLYYLLLVGALWVLGGRIAGRWGSVVAATGPMLLDIFTLDASPIYGPNDMLGEIPCAALFALALVIVDRRPAWAALLMGLAIQAKIMGWFLVPALVAAYLITHAKVPWRRTLRSIVALGGVALVPTVAFEAVKLALLGPTLYLLRVRQFEALLVFKRSADLYVAQKAHNLAVSWFLPTPVAVILTAGAAALLVVALVCVIQDRGGVGGALRSLTANREVWPGVVGILAGLTLLAEWFLTKNTSPYWIRYPSPGLLIGASLGLATVLRAARYLDARADAPPRPMRALVVGALVFSLPLQVADHIYLATFDQRYGTLPQQRAVAQLIRDTGVDSVQGYWGVMVPLAAEAGIHTLNFGVSVPPGTLIVLDDNFRTNFKGRYYGLAPKVCGEVLLRGPVVVCWPKE